MAEDQQQTPPIPDDQAASNTIVAAGATPDQIKVAAVSGSANGGVTYSILGIGPNKRNPKVQDHHVAFMWYVVLDVTTMTVVADETARSFTDVPPNVQRYLGDDSKFLFFITNFIDGLWLPQGALYDFLRKVGSGRVLDRAEQIMEELGYPSLPRVSYILAATMTVGDLPGFEEFSYANNAYLTMRFIPVYDKDGKFLRYAPAQ